MSDGNWMKVSRNVSMANGGAQVYAFGSELALADVLPNAWGPTSPYNGFIFDQNSDLISKGYLPSYKGVPLVKMNDALIPNTINGTPMSVLNDDIIYMLPAGMDKPVKVVFEGQSVTITKDPTQMHDHTYTFQVNMRVGVDVVVGAKFGAIKL